MGDLIRVTPSSPAPNYAPAYLAQDLGFFREEDLTVEENIYAGPGSSWLADNLLAGRADVALGGIWIPLAYRNIIGEFPIFALVCNRNPQVIMSRTAITDFTWSDLYDSRFMLSMSSTSQWMFLEGAMREEGVDFDRIKVIEDLDEATTMRLWLGGFADFYLVTPPVSEELEDKGFHMATTIAKSGGLVPWSVYYSVPEFINRSDKPATRFARAIQRSFDWIHSHEPLDTAKALMHRFPEVPLSRLVVSVNRLLDNDVWAKTIELPEKSFNRYQGMIAHYGLINEPYSFTKVVSTEIAQEVLAL